MVFRPMLACSNAPDTTKLQYPVLVSPKLDGIRCLITDDGPVTRTLKPIPNKRLRALLSLLPVGLDGELICGRMTGQDVWNRTSSAVMTEEAESSGLIFHIFDDFSHGGVFVDRYAGIRYRLKRVSSDVPAVQLEHHICTGPERVAELEERYVADGFEGLMIRDIAGPYKHGRSTMREGYLLKLKRFEDAEAIVVGAVERMHNENEAKVNALGLTERATCKDNKVPTGTLGALVCEMNPPFEQDRVGDHEKGRDWLPIRFEVGSGFTESQRNLMWADFRFKSTKLIGTIVKFKFQGLTPDGKPRFPVFLGFRDVRDM